MCDNLSESMNISYQEDAQGTVMNHLSKPRKTHRRLPRWNMRMLFEPNLNINLSCTCMTTGRFILPSEWITLEKKASLPQLWTLYSLTLHFRKNSGHSTFPKHPHSTQSAILRNRRLPCYHSASLVFSKRAPSSMKRSDLIWPPSQSPQFQIHRADESVQTGL